MNEWNLLAKVSEALAVNPNAIVEFKIIEGFAGHHWNGVVEDIEDNLYVIEDSDALQEAMVTRGWTFSYEIRPPFSNNRFISFSNQNGEA